MKDARHGENDHGICRDSRGFLEPLACTCLGQFDAAEDHGQLCRGDGEFLACGGGESERPLLQSSEVKCEPVAHEAKDLELVAASVLEAEDVAGSGVASKDRADDASEAVDPLASVLGIDGHVDGACGADVQHVVAPSARTSRASCWASADNGTRS